MTERTVNDHLAVLLSGSLVGVVLVFEAPALQAFFGKGGIALGTLGVFLLTAYALGHLVAILGNIIENAVTLIFGSPLAFVTFDPPRLVTAQHVAQLEERLRGRFSLKIDRVTGMDAATWRPVAEQIYHDVAANNPGRIEASYGTYSLNRDLCAACIIAAVISLVLVSPPWLAACGFASVALLYAHRMRRFDVRFSRELLLRFLALPPRSSLPPAPQPARR